MDLTPELIESVGKASVGIIAAIGGIIATIATAVTAFFTWKTRYELDKLYAKTYRPNEDGSPGPMRKHPEALVKMFTRKTKEAAIKDDQSESIQKPID